MSEVAFKEEQDRILGASEQVKTKEGKMYASNLLDIAKDIRNFVEHDGKLAEMFKAISGVDVSIKFENMRKEIFNS